MPVMPESVKSDPFWSKTQDPHIPIAVKQEIDGPTEPWAMAYNPAYAQVNAEEVWGKALGEVVNNGVKPRGRGRPRLRADQGHLRPVRDSHPVTE